MANIETLLADTRHFLDQSSDPAAPGAGERVLYTKAGGIYVRSSASIVGPLLDEAAHDALDHTGLTGVGGGVGGSSAFIGCVAQRTTDQTGIANISATAISFTGTDVEDDDAYHDPAVNPDRITVPTGRAGWYRPQAFIPWDVNATGYRQVFFRRNGSGYLDIQQHPASAGGTATYQTIAGRPVHLLVGDYLQVLVEHNSGGARDIKAGTLPAIFSLEFLGT